MAVNTKRVFYVIYVPDGEFRVSLDAIRLIANPQTRFASHITVRGPYPELVDVTEYSERIRDSIVRVADFGSGGVVR